MNNRSEEMSVLDYQVKTGDIKCNANEIRFLLYMAEEMNEIISERLYTNLTKEEQEKQKKYFEYLEYFQNKYLNLPAIRKKEKEWFDMLQVVQKRFDNIESVEDIEKANEAILLCKDNYEKAKKERKELSDKLDAIKIENYSGIFF